MQMSHRATPARAALPLPRLHGATYRAQRNRSAKGMQQLGALFVKSLGALVVSHVCIRPRQVVAWSANGSAPSTGHLHSRDEGSSDEQDEDSSDDNYTAWWEKDDPAYTWDLNAKINQCVQLLQSGDSNQQALAAKRLRQIAIPDVETSTAITAAGALPHLVRLVGDSNSDYVRKACAAAMLSLASEKQAAALVAAGAVPALMKNLKHSNESVAKISMVALRNIGINHTFVGVSLESMQLVWAAFTPDVVKQLKLAYRNPRLRSSVTDVLISVCMYGHEDACRALRSMGYSAQYTAPFRPRIRQERMKWERGQKQLKLQQMQQQEEEEEEDNQE